MNNLSATPQTAIYWRYSGKQEWCSGYASINAASPEVVKIGRWPGDQHGRDVVISSIEWKYKGEPK